MRALAKAFCGLGLAAGLAATGLPAHVPDVTGKREAAAVRIIREAHMQDRLLLLVGCDRPGIVLRQVPMAGSQAKPHQVIDIWVDRAPAGGCR